MCESSSLLPAGAGRGLLDLAVAPFLNARTVIREERTEVLQRHLRERGPGKIHQHLLSEFHTGVALIAPKTPMSLVILSYS